LFFALIQVIDHRFLFDSSKGLDEKSYKKNCKFFPDTCKQKWAVSNIIHTDHFSRLNDIVPAVAVPEDLISY